MAETTREEIDETVATLVVELKGIAQPHEIAQFRELALDAADADAPDQLAKIAAQIESLRNFCLSRAMSGAAHQLSIPVKRKRA
jgi:hypothetical protein